MKNRIQLNKRRYSALLFSLLSLTLLFAVSCEMDPVSTPDSDHILSEDVVIEAFKKGGKGNGGGLVEICHFPPGNPDNPQKITVGGNAAENHVKNHEDDGVVGVDYDENCQPLAVCPCYTYDDLAEYEWINLIDDNIDSDRWDTDLFSSVPKIKAGASLNLSNKRNPDGSFQEPSFGSCEFQYQYRIGGKKVYKKNIRKRISVNEANACRALLLEFGPDQTNPKDPIDKDPKEPIDNDPKEPVDKDPKKPIGKDPTKP